jgi:hypothetical protein
MEHGILLSTDGKVTRMGICLFYGVHMADIISNGMPLGTIMQNYKAELTLAIGVFIFQQHPTSLLGIRGKCCFGLHDQLLIPCQLYI